MSPVSPVGPGSPGSPAQDVIHDIGYRRYDGPRLGRGHVWRALALDSLRGAYGLGRTGRAKVVPLLCLAAVCLPALVAVVIAAVVQADELPVDYVTYSLNVQPVVALYVAAAAPVLVSRDLRFGLVPLHLSRPMRRSDYVSAKLAAGVAAVLALLAAPLTILVAGALLLDLPLGTQVPDYLRALAMAAVLAALLAAIGLVIAAATPRRGLGVAAVVTVLLVLSGVQAFAFELVSDESTPAAAGWTLLVSPFTLVQGLGAGLLGVESPLGVGPPEPVGPLVFALAAAALVAACWALLLLRYRRAAS